MTESPSIDHWPVQVRCADRADTAFAKQVAGQLAMHNQGNLPIKLFRKPKERRGRVARNINIYTCEWAGHRYFIKHYFKRRLVGHPLLRWALPPEAFKGFALGEKLQAAKIPVAEPVAAVAYQSGRLERGSVLITKALEGQNLRQMVQRGTVAEIGPDNRRKITRQTARVWARLINRRYIHQDAHIANFVVKNPGREPRVHVIDLDTIHHLPWAPARLLLHSLARFNASLSIHLAQNGHEELIRPERRVFLKELCRHLDHPRRIRALARLLARLTEKKIEHRHKIKQKRKARKMTAS